MAKIRLMCGILACIFGAATLAEIAHGKGLESIAMTAIPSVVLAAAWYFVGWIEFRR